MRLGDTIPILVSGVGGMTDSLLVTFPLQFPGNLAMQVLVHVGDQAGKEDEEHAEGDGSVENDLEGVDVRGSDGGSDGELDLGGDAGHL